jgi:hypothetical protein
MRKLTVSDIQTANHITREFDAAVRANDDDAAPRFL